ncbi:hypothetical protein MNEG_2419, partial [Monoraphidium neglectum]
MQGGEPHDPLPDHLRLQLGRTLAAFTLLHPQLFGRDGQLRPLAPQLKALLFDGSYAVREAAGQLLCLLPMAAGEPLRMMTQELEAFLPLQLPRQLQRARLGGAVASGSDNLDGGEAEPAGMTWETAAKRLANAAAGRDGGAAGALALAPLWETGVLQLLEAALAAPALEQRALLLLCGHGCAAQTAVDAANLQERVLPLCAAAAEVLAACSGYTPDRTPCALYHGPVLAWEWLVTTGLELRQLLAARHVLAAPRALSASVAADVYTVVPEPEFARRFGGPLLSALVMRRDKAGLQQLSQLLGHASPAAMMESMFGQAMGPLLALAACPQQCAAAAAATRDETLLPLARQQELLAQRLRSVTVHALCAAALVPGSGDLAHLQQQQQQQQQQQGGPAMGSALDTVPGTVGQPTEPLVQPSTASACVRDLK